MQRHFLITQLLGGLGNQMFQYAAGRRLAHEHGLDLLVDASILTDHTPGRHMVNRHFGLDIFNAEIKHATLAQRRRFNPQGLSLAGKIAHRIRRMAFGEAAYHETSYRYDEHLVSQSTAPPYIAGLWQSYKYFESISDLIRVDFSFRRGPDPRAAEIMGALSLPSSVCLHVRRGDYVSVATSAATMGFIGLEYYRAAVELVLKRLGQDVLFFVFSDDIEWCKAELSWLGSETVFVDALLPGLKSWQYFQIMSAGTCFVLSNSTFAWWAAWLSGYKDKTVIAPKNWFRDNRIDSTDLCPSQWIRV